MKPTSPINFRSFYYLELLSLIRKEGLKSLAQPQQDYLVRLLDLLEEEEDAQESIEKLAQSQTTSDLAIFFSDILDHLPNIPAEEAMKKLPERAAEFLDIFQVYLQQDEWRAAISQYLSITPAAATSEEVLSFDEFRRYVLAEKIDRMAETLEEKLQPLYKDYAIRTLTDPTVIDTLRELIADPRTNDFVSAYRALLADEKSPFDPNVVMDNFETNSQQFVELFANLYTDYPEEFASAFAPATELSEAESPQTEEVPFEALFEQAEQESTGSEEEPAMAETAGEIDSLAKEMAQLEKRPAAEQFTEEEKNRRQFLRDYVIGEINAYKEDILQTVQKLNSNGDDPQAIEELREHLKGLKDLGQIHAYPGVEKAAEALLNLAYQISEETPTLRRVPADKIDTLLSMLPDYVNAAVNESAPPFLAQIQNKIADIQADLNKTEPLVSLQDSATQEIALQSVMKNSFTALEQNLRKPDPSSFSEQNLALVDNIIFWCELLNKTTVQPTLGRLREIFQPSNFQQLKPEDQVLLREMLNGMGNSILHDSQELWSQYLTQLNDLSSIVSTPGVSEALVAFQDVTLRSINRLQEIIQTSPEDITGFIQNPFQNFFNQLQENSNLIQNDDLELLSRMMEIKISSFRSDHIQDAEAFWRGIASFLDDLVESINRLPNPVGAESLLLNFDRVMIPSESVEELTESEAVPEDETVEETNFFFEEETPEASPAEATAMEEVEESSSPGLTDSDIAEVFTLEALGYIDELERRLSQLRSNAEDRDAWHQFSITIHTLKGSAQMVKRTDVTEVAEPLDELSHKIEDDALLVTPQLVDILVPLVTALKQRLNGEEADCSRLLTQLENYKSSYEIAAPEPLVEEKAGSETPAEAPVEEPPAEDEFIYLEEKDPELLEIFQSEVSSNFERIENHLNNLEKFTYDKEAFQQVERSVHEIRSAAKMLGILEIATITDSLEKIVEKIVIKRPANLKDAISVIRNAMSVIKELTVNHKVNKQTYEELLSQLEHYLETDEVITVEPPSPPPLATETVPEIPKTAVSRSERQVTSHVMEMFIYEAREQLEDINYLLLKLEKDPGSRDMGNHLMRCMHTLKGSASMVYANHVETLSHRCEDLIEQYLQAEQPIPEELFDLLFRTVDEINFLLDSLQNKGAEQPQKYDFLLEELEQFLTSEKSGEPVVQQPMRVEKQAIQPKATETVTAPKASVAGPSPRKDTYLRLNINTMNHLLNLAAELVISNNQFKSQLDRLKELSPILNTKMKIFRDTEDYLNSIIREGTRLQEAISAIQEETPGTSESIKNQMENLQQVLENVKALQDEITTISHILKDNSKTYDENLQKLNKLSNELLDEIMQARLVPINMLFQRFHRPIRDLAREMNKQIQLRMSGEETELDRRLIEDLYEPLLHIIRNAIDHGLETPQEREAVGKPAEGILEIKASQDRNQVIIEISDDGRGIDVEAIRQTAIEKGLLTEEDIARLSEQELFELLFHPGFSTSEKTTKVSGRGVGLDVVKSQIEKAKGDIRIFTEKGKGTTFNIRVPISLSVVQSMLVDVSGHVYSIPLLQVEETVNVNLQDLISEDGKQYIRYREKKIPVIQLKQLLKVDPGKEPPMHLEGDFPVIIVQDEGNRVALMVNKIIRREEILIKSLGPGLRKLRYISGGSIMADGQVVLVLDIPQIIYDIVRDGMVEERSPANPAAPKPGAVSDLATKQRKRKTRIEGRKPSILIVDDSLSIRKYLNSLLMQKGFKTDTARNGYEALELLNKQHFDIMITDLEMPKLSGYELIETLRYDQRFASFPIIVLTGRAGENFRQLTTQLGADAYIVKPFQDQELLNQIANFIEYESNAS